MQNNDRENREMVESLKYCPPRKLNSDGELLSYGRCRSGQLHGMIIITMINSDILLFSGKLRKIELIQAGDDDDDSILFLADNDPLHFF